MSSELTGVGVIAAAVALPAAAAFGAGWMAWQAGKLLLEANAAADREIQRRQRRIQEARERRGRLEREAYEQLETGRRSVLEELERDGLSSVSLRQELRRLREETGDPAWAEAAAAAGLARLEQIVNRRDQLREARLGESDGDVAGLMERVAALAPEARETGGGDVRAADPAVLERVELNRRLEAVAGRVAETLEWIAALNRDYGIARTYAAWFESCFNGVEERIAALCAPQVSNGELKRGVRVLEETMKRYDTLYPTLEKERQKLSALYPVYAEAARALNEPVCGLRDFESADALEEKLREFQERARRAEVCAGIYRKLGPEAYLCYAWDEELRAMGYTVRSREEIAGMAACSPERGRVGEVEIPFYRWDQEALTQMYRIASQCGLQLIVHPNGTVTMQAIAEQGDPERVVAAQRAHCAGMETIRRRLRERWFISYDCEEKSRPETVHTLEEWRGGAENVWTRPAEELETGIRERTGADLRRMMGKE